MQPAFERVNRNAGKQCVRGVVGDRKLLSDNPWKHFTGVEGKPKPLRQFDSDELLGLLDHLTNTFPTITVGPLLAEVCLWSWGRRDEGTGLARSMFRVVGDEHHFEASGVGAGLGDGDATFGRSEQGATDSDGLKPGCPFLKSLAS